MPNHVHTLIQPINDWPLAKIVESWKKFTAMRICAFRKETISGNASLLSGDETKHVWHREYWDRFIRNEDHFRQTVEYIHFNPVKAKLVEKAEDWMWGSASVMGKYANREIGVPEGCVLETGDSKENL
jgi:type I restriction enzyme R subunit/putative DNA methylase